MKKAGDVLVSHLNRRKLNLTNRSLDECCRAAPSSVRSAERPDLSNSVAPCVQARWDRLLSDPSQWCDSRADKIHSTHAKGLMSAPKEEVFWLDRKHALAKENVDAARLPAFKENSRTVAIDMDLCCNLCREGQLSDAWQVLNNLVRQGSTVSTSLFYILLTRCTAEKNYSLGRYVHDLIVLSGHGSDTFLANHIICFYAAFEKLEEAIEVFFNVAAPDVYMWSSIILAHARHGQPRQAINLYQQMRRNSCVRPDNCLFVATFKACANAADLELGKEVHADYLESVGDLRDVRAASCLVDMYAKCGSLEDAHKVFDSLPEKDVVTWNSIIAGYVEHGFGYVALALYASMQHDGVVEANIVTFVWLLRACGTLGDLQRGKQLHLTIQKRGLDSDVVVVNCLVAMYAKCRSLLDARRVFDQSLTRDVVTWNSMIAGYVQYGLVKEAFSLFSSMRDERSPHPNTVTFICLLKACASTKALHEGKQIHAEIVEAGLQADVVVGGCLVDMYSKCGSLEDARRVFDSLPSRNEVSWTAMIAGYVKLGRSQDALDLFATMQQGNLFVADTVTLLCLLKACANIGAVQLGKQLHEQFQERGLEVDVVVASSLVDMYAKCGSMEDARRVFDSLPAKNVVTWSALLNGYAQHGHGKMAISCFHDMQQQGVEPDEATFLSLFVACSHEGLVKEGQQYFKLMVENHEITPNARHYCCMVDLLGRAGCLDEAEVLLSDTPFENCIVGWISLMSACKNHGDVDRGKRCFDRLISLCPDNSAAYALLGSIYANAGRWNDAQDVEQCRMVAGAWKKPGKACIEVKNKVHEFTVGSVRADVLPRLKSMSSMLKYDGGHVPQTELVLRALSDSDKENALCGHAEKLALAFGLLSTGDGETLRVTKNLRMCNDCHSSTKVLSRLEKREIIVRDAHRVHRFVDGCCSCADRN